jgi:protease-4
MKKFLLGLFIGLLFAVLVVVIVGFAAVRLGGDRPVTVADNSALVLDLEGSVPEQAPVDVPIPFLGQQQVLTVVDTWELQRKAAVDNHIPALVIEPRGLDVGWAKLEELHADIVAFKKSGKPVYAYLRGAGMRKYYLATAADKIFMAPRMNSTSRGCVPSCSMSRALSTSWGCPWSLSTSASTRMRQASW